MAQGPYLFSQLAFINKILMEHNSTPGLKTSNLVYGLSREGGKWKATGNNLEENALRFAYEFDKEGRRRIVDVFPSSLAFKESPGPATQFVEPVRNESMGYKSVGTLVQEILGISRQGEQRWRPF